MSPRLINEPINGIDYVLVHDEDLTDEELYTLVQSEEKKYVLLVKAELISLVSINKQTETLIFQPCHLVTNKPTIEDLIALLKDHAHIIVKNDDGEILSYLNAFQLSIYIWNDYKHLHAYLNTILRTINESCTVINQDEDVIFWTKGAENIFSVTHDEIIGKPITDFFSSERLEILNALNDGTSVKFHQHKAREDLVVLINSNPVYLNDEIIGAVVAETDITSQIHLNNELYNASEKIFDLEKEINQDNPFKNIRGSSPKLQETIDRVKKAATTDASILIQGESGVGKELFAKSVHHLREDKEAPYIAINCGAIPSTLFESEIFGYVSGAFSGAHQEGKKGKVELAQNGTLFLDEIGEMPLDMQVKLLRLLQEKKFYPVGGTEEIEVNFRVVAATNQDLRQLVKEGKFREDLFYRLNVVSMDIPPLRERPEDIIELTHYFLYECSIKYNRPIHGISQTIMQALLQHTWPGNIRELQNVIERLVVFSDDGKIKLEDIPFDIANIVDENGQPLYSKAYNNDNRSLKEQLEEHERDIILRELDKVDGNKLACAKNLDITRATLYNRMNRLGMEI